MADIKTHLRELSVAVTVGLLLRKYDFCLNELYNSDRFIKYAKEIIENDISSASNLLIMVIILVKRYINLMNLILMSFL